MSQKPTYEELDQRVKKLENAESARKLLQESLRESEERFRMIFTNSTDGIIVADPRSSRRVGATVHGGSGPSRKRRIKHAFGYIGDCYRLCVGSC